MTTSGAGVFPPEKKENRLLRAARDTAIVLIAVVLITVGAGVIQSVLPEKIISERTPLDAGLAYEDVTLTTSDGVRIAGWFVPARREGAKEAILILHGYPADKGDLVFRSAFLAETYNLLFIDFRYFGESEGRMTTAGVREVRDALAAVEELSRRGMEGIGVYGFSMGGAVALALLDRTDAVDAVVAEAAYADLALIAEETYRYLGPLKRPLARLTIIAAKYVLGVDAETASPRKAASRTNVPVLIVHSRNDKVIPFRHAEILREALKDNAEAEFSFTDDLVHGEPSAALAERVLAFFEKHLRKSE